MDSRPDRANRHRIVMLGASNLTRGISTVVETAQQLHDAPLDIYAALGHGRSYGRDTTVKGRTLPGIVQCGLWSALDRATNESPTEPTAALVTDIGNDLLYEAPVELIVEWVALCLDRLRAIDARVVMTLLPMGSVESLGALRFRVMKKFLFPRCTLSFDTVRERAAQLHDALVRLGTERGATLVENRRAWYGFDPIHIQMRHWSRAWSEILAAWSQVETPRLARGSTSRWLYLRSLQPERYQVLGLNKTCPQPAGRLRDGTTISLF